MWMNITKIIMWIIIATLNSFDFDKKSIIIWLATFVIILDEISLILGGMQ